MKKMIITCALIASASVMSYAQDAAPKSPMAPAHNAQMSAEQIADRQTKMYEKQLGLSKEQVQKVHDIQLQFATQRLSMQKAGVQPGSGQAMQMGMAEDQQMKNVLTSEQFTKYSASRPKMNPAGNPQKG